MVINAKDLRIGNYIYSIETQNIQRILTISEEYLTFDNVTFDYPTYEEIEPIEVTKEILLKCHNHYLYSKYKLIKYKDYLIEYDNNNDNYILYDGNSMTKITTFKYLHEYQNIIYAITKQELIINL